ncbi:MAG: hypothetical protein IJB59_04465 [Oscillospiraceae bacterium]|nr:hypothetical protein [Oscillospiraceae bacterium]
MKKTLITILVVIVLVLALGIAGMLGYVWYRDNHVFVEGAAYPIAAEIFDLREDDISFEHYEELKSKLPDVYILWNVPFQNEKYASDTQNLTVSSLTEEDVAILVEYFPYLKNVDASKCDDYPALELLKAQLPQVKVSYTVSLGGDMAFEPDADALVLSVGDYELETMTRNLIHLPYVQSIKLKMPELTLEQVDALRERFPEIEITCTVEIQGQEYDTQTTELDLSWLSSDAVEDTLDKLTMLPGLTHVKLTADDGSNNLTKVDVRKLMEALPQVAFDYSFDFYGEKVSTASEEIVLKNVKIGDEGEEEIRQALDLLINCKRFVLDSCGVSNEVMAKIRDDYREQTKVVWRVKFGKGSSLTDAEIIRAVYDLVDSNCANLVYCEDARYMDIGHNEFLDTCEFVSGMVSLEYVIISGSPIKDLTPFSNCKKLKVLEAAFCEYIYDATPLAQCDSLEMLNISNTHITDLSPLDNLNLTHLCAKMNPSGVSRVSVEEQERFMAQHPDCWATFTGSQPYGPGWRYTEDNKDMLPWYAEISYEFRYDIYPATPNHVGWYTGSRTDK